MTEFGVSPTIAWQLDPFGHSAAIPEVYSALGIDTIVFAREDENRK